MFVWTMLTVILNIETATPPARPGVRPLNFAGERPARVFGAHAEGRCGRISEDSLIVYLDLGMVRKASRGLKGWRWT